MSLSPAKVAGALLSLLPVILSAQSTDQRRPIGSLLEDLDRYIESGMAKTGVPGVAAAVVYQDRVVYLKGFGVRKAGETARIDPDTVFQLASVSKPIASTIVAALVGAGDVSWDDRIIDLDPQFRLSDPNVTRQLTIRDLLSHRSGLPTSSGDVLEDLGFTRPEILHQMRLLPLPGQFRKTYEYSNFGYTEGAIAAAKHVRTQWEDLAEERLFRPLGMKSTSYRYSDFERLENKAAIHVIIDGKPIPRYKRDPDAEAPAGSASSSVRDLAQWLRLQLACGTWNGRSLIDAKALRETHSPQIVSGKNLLTGAPDYYGLGWNVTYDANKNVTLSHSGAFFVGAGTTVKFSPSAQLGIIVLTNARPTGLAEATANTLFDLYNSGRSTQDWLALFSKGFEGMINASNNEATDYSKLDPPKSPTPSKPLTAYVGTYRNDYYGDIEFTKQRDSLWMRLPRTGTLYQLTHWDGDKFTYRFEAEQGIGTRGVVFSGGGQSRVLVENLAIEGDGNFVRTDAHSR